MNLLLLSISTYCSSVAGSYCDPHIL